MAVVFSQCRVVLFSIILRKEEFLVFMFEREREREREAKTDRQTEHQRLRTIGNTLLRKPNECPALIHPFLHNRTKSHQEFSVIIFNPTENLLRTHIDTHRVHIQIQICLKNYFVAQIGYCMRRAFCYPQLQLRLKA